MRDFIHRNSLAIFAFGLFFTFWAAMSINGYLDFNEQQKEQGRKQIAFLPYLTTGHFWEATCENWESEFLEMGLFVLLTAFLFQKGSAETKTDEEHKQEQREEDQEQSGKEAEGGEQPPWPVRRGGLIKSIYENSLSIALLSLFAMSFIIHAIAGAHEYNLEQSYVHQPAVSVLRFVTTPNFWFQSFQNWQSEFLGVGSMIVLTIYLRQKGSSQSKRVGAPAGKTGSD